VKHVDEYRDPARVAELARRVLKSATRTWTIMEVCGGQTHGILSSGLDAMIASRITLLHGPGCPVCVTPIETLDRASALASDPNTILCSFGDMLRVPGSRGDLLSARARGADVRIVYAPLDAVRLAERLPERRVIFLAVGFETTAPAVAIAARVAREKGLTNFFLLTSHVRVPPALEAILDARDTQIDAFLAAGHVCTVMGTGEYGPIAERWHVPLVVTGFEPVDILEGVWLAVQQLERGEAVVQIQYARAVRPDGNPAARALVESVFEVADRPWRGLGVVPHGGLRLRDSYAALDAERCLDAGPLPATSDTQECHAAEVLRGALRPSACPAFGTRCTPEQPLGAPMVSSEGACAAYYRYRGVDAADASQGLS
jgi:hydrogenase expression/formation protein HypD